MTDTFIVKNISNKDAGLGDSYDHENIDDDLELNEPLPRLCHMKLTRDHTGYGFNLKSKRERLCQFIGKVDPNTPAFLAGLRDNDRIVEINCKNVESSSHERILELIKQGIKRNGFLRS